MATIHRIPTRSTQPLSALCPMRVGIEEQEHVLAGDLGQAGHHQDVGGDDPPATQPPRLGPEGAGGPGEGGAAVGVGGVEGLVPVGDQQHRDEGQDGDDRRLQAGDGDDHEAQGGGEAVGRRGRGHPHHYRGDEPEGTPLQALVSALLVSQLRIEMNHGAPVLCRDMAVKAWGHHTQLPPEFLLFLRLDVLISSASTCIGTVSGRFSATGARNRLPQRRPASVCPMPSRSFWRLEDKRRDTCIWLTPTADRDLRLGETVDEAHAEDRLLARRAAWPARGPRRARSSTES